MAETDKPTQVPCIIKESQKKYLKSKGINRSEFMRQAIDAHVAGTFKYKYI